MCVYIYTKIVWNQKHVILTMVHVYHLLRRCGHLRAIPEVTIYLSSFSLYIYRYIYIYMGSAPLT